ncbi:methyltransferase domain-containing protein [Photobacterium sp. SDRW27]|uniref:class I SAM-dependent DNA methyltransferase n=1 Tax=Photobacterium obscurum TaxID=2829490 RepID=UPI0022446342|nr:class I SAM-dependent methyltransferase [Photobacterium obscurum]MCW8331991.1 methyltransferase domain-containing protein [Photobacterium obscurum]
MKSELYSTHAEKYDAAVQDNIYNAQLERPTLQSMLSELSGANVLDLGCGSGVYAEFLINNGASKITCVDYSQEMVELVKRKFGERVKAYAQDLSIGLPDESSESFDVVICPLVIHYIENLTPLFKDISRVLKTGGYFAFSTHHPFTDFECSKSGNYFETELVQDVWNTIGKPVEVSYYRRSLTEIMDAITASGLSVTQLSEGQVSESVKTESPETYEYLSRNPNFIFIKCHK